MIRSYPCGCEADEGPTCAWHGRPRSCCASCGGGPGSSYPDTTCDECTPRLAGSLSLDERDEAMTLIEIGRGEDPKAPVDNGPLDNWGGW